MSRAQIIALALGAITLFWMVGAHNRLVALRNAITQAWARLQDTLDQRARILEPLLAALRVPLAAEHGALDALQTAHAEARRAAAAMAQRPVHPDPAQAWTAAEAAVSAAAARVMALLDQHAELRDGEPVVALATAWHHCQARLPVAREVFNDAAAAYDEARVLFPTRLLMRLFRFGPAGRL